MKELLSNYLNGADLPGTMALTLVLWLCSLVLVALIVLPLFGAAVALIVAAALLLVSLAVCWDICTYRTAQPQNLHGLRLPSGAQTYFVRQGAFTLLLTYSAAADSRDLDSGVQRLRADLPPTSFDLFAGLEPRSTCFGHRSSARSCLTCTATAMPQSK